MLTRVTWLAAKQLFLIVQVVWDMLMEVALVATLAIIFILPLVPAETVPQCRDVYLVRIFLVVVSAWALIIKIMLLTSVKPAQRM